MDDLVECFERRWRRTGGASVPDTRIREVEQALGVSLPDSLLALARIADGLQPQFDLLVNDGQIVSALARMVRIADDEILQWHEAMLEDAENKSRDLDGLRWVIPVADNGDGWICLDFRGDPSRVTHQVVSYEFSCVSQTDPNGLFFVADDFEAVLRMLKVR